MNAKQLLGLFTEVSAWKKNSRKFVVAISPSLPRHGTYRGVTRLNKGKMD
jgi:hypothetical protein